MINLEEKVVRLTGRFAIVLTNKYCHRFDKGTIVAEVYNRESFTDRLYWWQSIDRVEDDKWAKYIGVQAMCDSDLMIIGGGNVRYN